MMKKYYIPGMFSIILLPIMCMWYFGYRGFFEEKVGIELIMEDPLEVSGCVNGDAYNLFKGVEFATYEFTGDIELDNKLMFDVEQSIDTLIFKNNLEKGVLLVWNDNMKYARYIKIIDLLENSKGKMITYPDSIKYVYDKEYYLDRENFRQEHMSLLTILNEEKDSVDEVTTLNNSLIEGLIGNYKYLLILNFILLVFFSFKRFR